MSAPLTDAQRDFIPHVLEHVFPETAARRCGMDPHMALRWMQNPTFRDELNRQRKIMAQNVMHALETYANKAVITLVEMLHPDKNDGVRIKAADSILTHTIEYRKLYGLEDRIEALEEVADIAKQVRK